MSKPPHQITATITDDLFIGRKQHWVAKSYLKPWCDPLSPQGAYLWISPKDRSIPPRLVSPKKAFVSPDMNTMRKGGLRNLSLEDLYSHIETNFGKIKSLVSQGMPISEKEVDKILGFVSAHLVRTPKFRDAWKFNNLDEGVIDSISDPDVREDIRTVSSRIAENHKQILCHICLPEIMKLLGSMRMILLKSHDAEHFITSDAPCCVIQYKDRIKPLFETLESPTSNVIMPLSPNLIAIFEHSEDPHEMIGIFPESPLVHEINAIIWMGADKEIVMRKLLDTERLLEAITLKASRYAVL